MTWNVTGNLSLMLHSPYSILRIREPPVLVSQGLIYSTLKSAKKLSGDLLWKLRLCSSRKYLYPLSLPPPPPFTEDNGNSEGRGSKRRQFPRGWGMASRVFFPGVPSKFDEQAISYFTVFRCFKAKIIVFFNDLLFAVGWLLFFTGLHDG